MAGTPRVAIVGHAVDQQTFLRGVQHPHGIKNADGAVEEVEFQMRSDMADSADVIADSLLLRKAINALPKRLKDVFDLHYLQGLSFSHIAVFFGCTPSTAQDLLRAARSRLVFELATSCPDSSSESRRPAPPLLYQQAIRRLAPRRREVLERHVYQSMRPAQIAAELAITAGCARVHLHLAYKELAGLLGIADYRLVVDQLKPPPIERNGARCSTF